MWHFMLGDFLVAGLSEPDNDRPSECWVLYFNDKDNKDRFMDFETKGMAEKFFFEHAPGMESFVKIIKI